MATVSEIIPQALQPEVDAALAWFNTSQSDEFEVTGIIDADRTLGADAPRELRLVLCGGNTCQQRSFRVSSVATGFDIAYADADRLESDAPTSPQAELDPPPGALRGWLDELTAKHAFTVLVFYRGYW